MADTSMNRRVYWVGDAPTRCDICQGSITETFIDGATVRGPWANMCPRCHGIYGRGLGMGQGQRYDHQRDTGKWLRVDG